MRGVIRTCWMAPRISPAAIPARSAARTTRPIMSITLDQWQGKPRLWRVSWAALWAADICDRPTANTSVAPMNTQTRPAWIRWEIERETVLVRAVMDTLRATDMSWG